MNKDIETRKELIAARIIVLILSLAVVTLLTLHIILKKEYWDILHFSYSLIISFIVAILLHETGHLIFGLISHYKFISFQFLCFKSTKIGKKTKISVEKGITLGQCLMGVEPADRGKVRYKLYMSGGVIMNILLFVLSVTGLILIYVFKGDLNAHLLACAFINGYLIPINYIPLNNQGIYNDGLNLKLMNKYESVRHLIINTLSLQYLVVNNVCINDIPEDLLNNDGLEVDKKIVHTFVLDYYKTVKLIVNNDDNKFSLVNERNRTKYDLPLVYRLQNFEFLLIERLINDEEYMWIYSLKENQKYFENDSSFTVRLCNILRRYKEDSIDYQGFTVRLRFLKDELYDDETEIISQELGYALIKLAEDYSDKREELKLNEN